MLKVVNSFPLVIWGANAKSEDFYMTVLGLCGYVTTIAKARSDLMSTGY